MKKMKKIFAMLLAFTMVLGMTVTASAETSTKVPSEKDKRKITATGIAEDKNGEVTVTAYKIIKANYTDNGFTGYSWESGCGYDQNKPIFNTNDTLTTEDDFLNLTDQELATLATKTADLKSFEMVQNSTTKTTFESEEELEAGTYMILVTGSSDVVYNPMIASVYYKIDGSGINSDVVDANTKWTLVTNEAYAKSTDPSVKKVIVKADNSEVKGDDGATDEEINFKITGTIPSYSKQYTTVTYDIIDTLSDGLDFASKKEEVVVKVDGNKVTAADDTYSVVIFGRTMTISFKSEYVLANGLKGVEVTYKAKFNEDATLNFDDNTNTVYAEYSNNPTDTSQKGKTPEVVTHHYTFGIDADLNGVKTYLTKELLKTDSGKTEVKDGKEEIVYEYLNGAEFTLTRTDAPADYTGKKVYTAVTGAGGVAGDIQFKGLDAGTYKLVETKAPVGYQLDTTEHTVVITASYNLDGTLKSYKIVIDGVETGTCEYENKSLDGTNIKTIDRTKENTTLIKNTKLIALPSTGGIGTTIFTIAGCGIMIAAAFFFFASRKKEN